MAAIRRRAALLMALVLLILPLHALAREDAPSYSVDSLEDFKSLFLGLTEHLAPENIDKRSFRDKRKHFSKR